MRKDLEEEEELRANETTRREKKNEMKMEKNKGREKNRINKRSCRKIKMN